LVMMCMASAHEISDVVPETPVGEMKAEVGITKECFEKSCDSSGCHLAKMACAAEAQKAPWLVFISPDTHKKRLVNAKGLEQHVPGLVDVVDHKHAQDPDLAIAMPGIPRKAPKALLDALKKQDKVIAVITNMERKQIKMDPMHTHARQSWLKLAETVKHMPISPAKIKNEDMLLKLAKQLADQEKTEREHGKTSTQDTDSKPAAEQSPADTKKEMIKKLISAVMKAHPPSSPLESKEQAVKELMPFIKKVMNKMEAGAPLESEAQPEAQEKTVDGLPVSHRKCMMRACIKKQPDGTCGAAVISCGSERGDKVPAAERTALSKKDAKKLLKKTMPLIKQLTKSEEVEDASALVSEVDEEDMF